MGEKLTVRMDFIPYYQEDFSYYITPTVSFTQDYRIIISGDLAEYVHVEKDYYERVGPKDTPILSGYLKLPETLEPGEHVAKITVMETAAPGSAAISVLAGVRGVIYVRSYYPEPYPIFTFRANSGNVNETSTFISKIENWGKKPINNGYVEVIVSDQLGNELGRIESERVSIISGASKDISMDFSLDGFGAGMYNAKAIFHSNVNDMELSDKFQVGEMTLFVYDVPNTVYSGVVAPVTFAVRSNWGKPLNGVYTYLKLGDQVIESPSRTIPAWGSALYTSYVDGGDLVPGPAELEIEIVYDDYRKIETFPVTVGEPVIEQVKAAAISPPSGFDYFLVFIILLIALFGVVNTVLYVKYKRFGEAFN